MLKLDAKVPGSPTASKTDAARPGLQRTHRFSAIVFSLAAAIAALPAPARADLFEMSVQNSSVVSPGTGFFDVMMTYTGSAPSVAVGGIDYTLSVNPSSTLLFTAATTTSAILGAPTYIFAGNSVADTFTGGSLDAANALSPSGATSFYASDLALAGGTTFSNGQTLDIGRISYSVGANLPVGTIIPVTIAVSPAGDLSDSSGNPITNFSTVNGSVMVVPEMNTMTLVASTALLALVARLSWSRWGRRGGTLPRSA